MHVSLCNQLHLYRKIKNNNKIAKIFSLKNLGCLSLKYCTFVSWAYELKGGDEQHLLALGQDIIIPLEILHDHSYAVGHVLLIVVALLLAMVVTTVLAVVSVDAWDAWRSVEPAQTAEDARLSTIRAWEYRL